MPIENVYPEAGQQANGVTTTQSVTKTVRDTVTQPAAQPQQVVQQPKQVHHMVQAQSPTHVLQATTQYRYRSVGKIKEFFFHKKWP